MPSWHLGNCRREISGVFWRNFAGAICLGECMGRNYLGSEMSVKTTEGRNVRISMQNYKSIRIAVTICAILVNTHTDTDIQLLTAIYY